MRRDRTGEPLDEDVIEGQDVHNAARCSGWVDRARGVPCLTCRPWLRKEEHEPASAEAIEAARQHLRDVLGWPA